MAMTLTFSRKANPTPASGLPSVQTCQRKRVFRPREGITPAWRHSGVRRGSNEMRLSIQLSIPPCRLEQESRMLALYGTPRSRSRIAMSEVFGSKTSDVTSATQNAIAKTRSSTARHCAHNEAVSTGSAMSAFSVTCFVSLPFR